eukprot:COSAG01_NODE_64_length_29509_cov_1035.985209_2_plen_105_part_00
MIDDRAIEWLRSVNRKLHTRFFSSNSFQKASGSPPVAAVTCLLPAPTHDGALLDWRLPPSVRSSYGPVAAAIGALGGPAAGARAFGCVHSHRPPHASLPFVGLF